jgi:hypothetical protein
VQALYATAVDHYVDVDSRIEAVGAICSISGDKSTDALLEISLHPGVEVNVRVRAIQGLKDRWSPEIATRLAVLLQPHNSIVLRNEVSTAIREHSCPTMCIRFVLHYLERIWRGERGLEDRFPDPEPTQQRLEAETLDSLYGLLLKNKLATLRILTDIYGLGTTNPSPFALLVIEKTALKEACSELIRPFELASPDDPRRHEIENAFGRVCR